MEAGRHTTKYAADLKDMSRGLARFKSSDELHVYWKPDTCKHPQMFKEDGSKDAANLMKYVSNVIRC